MEIWFTSEIDTFKFQNKLRYRNWLDKVARSEQRVIGEISYFFVDKERILSINTEFLSHTYYTDIITFDDSYLNKLQGEIFICIPVVIENSLIHNNGSFELELNRVILHGLLHMIGYKDKSVNDVKLMRSKEDQYLKVFGGGY